MRKKDIDEELQEASFDFFYWFSRFEFALKENRLLQCEKVGAPTEPSWRKFHHKFGTTYAPMLPAILR
jgi:hypothetical protein